MLLSSSPYSLGSAASSFFIKAAEQVGDELLGGEDRFSLDFHFLKDRFLILTSLLGPHLELGTWLPNH